jgi:hypothetical protein
VLTRHCIAAVLSILLATAAHAFERGNVLVEHRTEWPALGASSTSYDLQIHLGARYTLGTGGVPLLYRYVPYGGPGHLLVPAPNQYVFHHDGIVAMWDGVYVLHSEGRKGYVDLFSSDAELSEIAPMRSGNFLVAQRRTALDRAAKLIEFNAQGRVAEYSFPTNIDRSANASLGAMHIELLRDQCTVLYTLGSDEPAGGSRVRRMNICTNQRQPDFAALQRDQYAGAIRQLQNGDVLVANGTAVLHFTPDGALLRSYYFEGVTHIALSTDGSSFWAAGIAPDKAFLRSISLTNLNAPITSIQIGNDGLSSLSAPVATDDLVVIGEWRASAARLKTRAARR